MEKIQSHECWQEGDLKKLTKAELQHLLEHNQGNKKVFRESRETQLRKKEVWKKENNGNGPLKWSEPCWTCRNIASKVNILPDPNDKEVK